MYLTNLHIKVSDPEQSHVYYREMEGPQRLDPDLMPMVRSLLNKLLEIDRKDFLVDSDGMFWRGRIDKQVVDGKWFRLRRMQGKAPDLGNLPSPMPQPIRNILMSKMIKRGGLIHIAGGPGTGKTTTGAATVVSRLMEFGGVAYTVEDPPELVLNGWHGNGYCTQTWVAGDDEADWTESMRGVLRSQPSGTNLIMYVGEVRDPETARVMLRAASNGFLVISTGFGSDIVSGIDTFFQLIGREHAASLANALRVIVHQTLENDRFGAQVLTSESASSPVGNIIRSASGNPANLAQLENEIRFQKNYLMQGNSLLAA